VTLVDSDVLIEFIRNFRSIDGLRIETFPTRPWSSVHEPTFSYYVGPETIYRVVEVEG
jgi:hypothetical protein